MAAKPIRNHPASPFGQGGKPHIDDDRPGCYNFLYYPMLEWQIGWEGETLF